MPKREDILQEAYDLIKEGHHAPAEIRLMRYLRHHKRDVSAWWLLAIATEVPERKREALETVLKLNPEHKKARALLGKMPAPPSRSERSGMFSDPMNVLIAVLGVVAFMGVSALMMLLAARFLPGLPLLLPQGEGIMLFEAEVDLSVGDPDGCGLQFGPPRVGRLRGSSTDDGDATFTDCSNQHVWVLDARADENYAITLDAETSGLSIYVLRVDSPPDAETVDVSRGRSSSPTGATAFFRTTDPGDYRIVVAMRRDSAYGTYTIESQRR